MIRLSKIVKEGEEPKRFSNEVKKHFLEIVSTYNKYQEMMDRKSDITEIAETLGGITDAARELAVNEADDWFDAHTVKRNMNELTKLGKSFDQVAIEAKNLDQRLHGLYEDMGHILSRYYKIGEISEEQMRERLGLREDGKLQGGEKDPCWKGYEMIGMKPGKGGAQVPNCVPKNESVNEALGNDKAMLALVDMLSNSMEHYASANEFVNITSKIPGFANYKSELKDVFAKYWKVDARQRNDWNTKEWLKWLKQWPLEESKTNCVDCGKVNEEAKPILKPGTKVKLRGGKSGKIVRFDGKTPGSPFYIVDIGQYYSIEVPANELETESVNEEVSDKKVDAKLIANKMRKNQSTKAFADKVEKMGKVSHKDLEKMLPDYVSGGIITNLFKESIKEEKPGLWANIRAKKARGEAPAHKNSDAYKDAVAAGKKINKEAAYGYKDSTASYIDKHKEEFKAAEKMNKGNEQSFYDSLSTLEEKLGHPKYMIFLSNALRGYKVDMYKDPKIKNQQEAEEALFLLSK
jgi:hypothetical protein